MNAWIATQSDWLRVERLPGYAHDLNPIEMVWGNVKQVELANLCPDIIDQAHAAADSGLNHVGSSYDPVPRLPRPHRPFATITDHPIIERSLSEMAEAVKTDVPHF